MYKRYLYLSMLFSAGLVLAQASMANAEDTIAAGELVFADCEEYVNIRSGASEDSEVIAKLYNHHAATIVEAAEDGWYEITSGNVTGYIKGEYLASGEEADAIAEEVAYNVAVVNAVALNVRTQPSEDSEILDVAEESEELEVVNYDGGWMTVALGNDQYGYVSPDYCEYKTYYPIAITLEEEAAAEAEAEAAAQAEAEAAAQAEAEVTAQAEAEAAYVDTAGTYSDTSSDGAYEDTSYSDGSTDAAYTDSSSDTSYSDTSSDTSYTDTSYTDTSSDTSYTDTSYTDTSSDTSYTDTSYTDTSSDTSYTDTSYTDTSSDASYTDTSYTDTSSDTSYTDTSYTDTSSDASYTDSSSETTTDTTDSTSSDSSLGQQIADYAVQFVGNPYVYGGTSLTNGTDCSGFTQSVMAQFGISIPRTAADQAYSGTSISVSEVQAGDLLFYSSGSGISHVALYIGGGQIVHASTEETGIIISSAYYSTPVCAARYW